MTIVCLMGITTCHPVILLIMAHLRRSQVWRLPLIEVVRNLEIVKLIAVCNLRYLAYLHIFDHLLVGLAEAAIIKIVISCNLFYFLNRPYVLE